MGIWLGSWSGDHAGKVEGRQPNRVLISLTHTDGTFPIGLFQKADLNGTPWYYEVHVTCLTPGLRSAIATSVDKVGDYVWSVELAEVDWGQGLAAWKPGVHLFSVMLLASGGHQSGVIGTAVIDKTVKRVDATSPPMELMTFLARSR